MYDFSAAIRAEQKKAEPSKINNEHLAEYYMFAGQCNQMLGQYEEAVAHYAYGISRSGDKPEIYFHKGLAHVSMNDYKKGLEEFNAAWEKSPGAELKFKILLNLGINYRRIGDLDKST